MSAIKFPLIFFLITTTICLTAQSTSVFDANYFDKDNTAPPLKIGKGFHINDVYKQTRGCFTPESCKQTNLTSEQTGGKKTSIKLYHTRTNDEYNSLRKRGASGKVSFLNLFSFGGSKLDEYANKSIKEEERIVFTANVDFGSYSFETEPQLTEEAKGLISQKKLQDFVKYFGTHYISGIRKESTIYVILTKKYNEMDERIYSKDQLELGLKNPVGWKGSLQTENSDNVNTILTENEFTAEVEIHGPAIEQSSLKGQITDILNAKSSKKADAIAKIIEGVLKNISDPNQSVITQYYYSPFDLYGLEGIYWNEKKQNELTKLNEAIINVYSSKTQITEFTSEKGKQQFIDLFIDNSNDNNVIKKFTQAYDKSLPTFINLKNKADANLKELEAKYIKCSDIYCANTNTCCSIDSYLQEIEKFNYTTKIKTEEKKLIESVIAVANEVYAPECEKKKMAIIKIDNFSSNPYSLYQGDKFIQRIGGKETVTFTVALGTYKFKAVQDSGYLMYATVNHRTANLQTVCEEVVLKIGFED